jgi:hypothetical protein
LLTSEAGHRGNSQHPQAANPMSVAKNLAAVRSHVAQIAKEVGSEPRSSTLSEYRRLDHF